MIDVKSFIEEPLVSLMKKYGIPYEAGETNVFYLETHEQEGDIVITDYIDEHEFPEIVNELENAGKVTGYVESLDKELDNEYLNAFLTKAEIERSEINELNGFMFFDEDFTKGYVIGYQVFTLAGMDTIAFEM